MNRVIYRQFVLLKNAKMSLKTKTTFNVTLISSRDQADSRLYTQYTVTKQIDLYRLEKIDLSNSLFKDKNGGGGDW